MTNLPEAFLAEMKQLLKEEYEAYLDCFSRERYYGLRVNTSKISVEDFLKISSFRLRSIPWTTDGFYYEESDQPARHPFYHAGLYYIQEPSAMLPGEVLPIEENDLVLDCCAAPGGKSLKLANRLNGTGLLIANDISASRAQVLLKTLESSGIRNSYVMAEDIRKLDRFSETFDRILLDAPCSGEGMFRKEPELIRSWLEKDSSYYSPLQKELIVKAAGMLKPGGTMVYSTCTFSPKENEEVIEHLLDVYPDMETVPIRKIEGFRSGVTDRTKGCIRLYPHLIEGEGHFVALLKKKGQRIVNTTDDTISEISEPFLKDIVPSFFKGKIVQRKDRLYLEPVHDLDLEGLRILRSGLLLGEFVHERFEPSQALASALKKDEYMNVIDLAISDPRVLKYLKCETLDVKDFDTENYVLVCTASHPLGFGKVKNGILKNRYPANYRLK